MYGVTPVGYVNQPCQPQPKPQPQQGSSAVSINIFEPKVINYPPRTPKTSYDYQALEQYQPRRYQPINVPIPVPVPTIVPQPIYYNAPAPQPQIAPQYIPIHKDVQPEKPIFQPAPMVEIPEVKQRTIEEIPVKEPEIQEQPVYVPPPVMQPQGQTVMVNQPVTQEIKQVMPEQPVPLAPAPVVPMPVMQAPPLPVEPSAAVPMPLPQEIPATAPAPLPSPVVEDKSSPQSILTNLPQLNQDLASTDYNKKLEALNQIAKLSLGSVEGDESVRQNLINAYTGLVKELAAPALGEKDPNKENADKVKQRSMFTLALLNKAHNGDTPLAELPGLAQIASVLKNDSDPNMRASAISALEHMTRPQDVSILSKIFKTKSLDDPSPKVKAIAKDAYENIIKIAIPEPSASPQPVAPVEAKS